MPRVSYFYDNEVGSFYYGQEHPMKPFRIKMSHQLIVNYGLYRKMSCYLPHRASDAEMSAFHSPEYIQHLRTVAPLLINQQSVDPTSSAQVAPTETAATADFKVGENDCPCFQGMFEFSQISSGASIDAAIKLNHKSTDIAINWSGGLHHAKK